MGQEIERKFLVDTKKLGKLKNRQGDRYTQGYICNQPDREVRIRIIEGDNTENREGMLTIKGRNTGLLLTRTEFNIPIDISEAIGILNKFCGINVISKIRRKIEYKGHLWEVDEFLEDNEGLWLAEIELTDECEQFEKPDWIKEEVTYDKRYKNANLIKYPYKMWER